jgi:hypothetical protein
MKKPIKKGLPFGLAFLAVVLAGPSPSRASDHIDGLQTGIDLAADLTDLFTFTSPSNPDKLVLVMNVHGLAFSKSRFSNAVDYKFRIRPIDDARTLAPSTDPRREQSIVCSFTGGTFLINSRQRATCTFNLSGATAPVSFDTRGGSDYRAGGEGSGPGVRVFAGVRSDPWFLDLGKTIKFNKGEPVPRTSGSNGLQGTNILSIVVEVDKRKLGTPLLAVTAQTIRK